MGSAYLSQIVCAPDSTFSAASVLTLYNKLQNYKTLHDSYINPMHYFIDVIRTVFIRGGGLHETAHQVLALAGIGTLMGCWAVQSYKKNS
ncbi:hypothetical protein CIK91_10000 [Segatella bryantii]|uniref:Uncharacterized protein n=1 Tax=Segatella bryantii TaxID=77095 RepID=A0ABX4EJ29_SEGBR|nr:hypothetical protein CIK91_10000 [Segatella bryantii]